MPVEFNYDNFGRRTQILASNGEHTRYQYDGLSRVTQVKHPYNTLNLTYTQASQIKSKTHSDRRFNYVAPAQSAFAYQNNALNQANAVSGVALAYDARGNMTRDSDQSTYTYNA